MSVKVVRAEHFKKKLPVDGERARMQRIFRRRFAESPEVTEEAVIVEIAEKRERWTDDRKIEWMDKFTKDHLHLDVQRFRDLIDGKKAAGKAITYTDGVEAYLLIWGYGRKSMIGGFLWAMGDDYPEFRMGHKEVKEVVREPRLIGPPEEREVIKRIPWRFTKPEELASDVGEVLSRMKREEIVGEVIKHKEAGRRDWGPKADMSYEEWLAFERARHFKTAEAREAYIYEQVAKPKGVSEEEWQMWTPCAVCGRRGYDEWAVSDEDWLKYVPVKYQDKDICRVCYERFKAGIERERIPYVIIPRKKETIAVMSEEDWRRLGYEWDEEKRMWMFKFKPR